MLKEDRINLKWIKKEINKKLKLKTLYLKKVSRYMLINS